MKSGCHHHHLGMDYLHDAIFKIAASEVKLRFRLDNSASRIERDKILLSDGVKSCHLESCHLPQLHWQESMALYRSCSLPSIMALEITGVAINHCLSRYSSHSEQISAGGCDELSLVLRCLCSKVCAERGVISIAR